MVVFGGKSSSAKTKLFEQPLDKLFSPKAIKQLNEAISASSARLPLSSSLSAPLTSTSLTWAKLSQDNSVSKRRRTLARLRRFTIGSNNNANLISAITSPPTAILSQEQQLQQLCGSLSTTSITSPATSATSTHQLRTTTTQPQPQTVVQNTSPDHDEIDSQIKMKNNLEQPSNQIDEAERARLLLNVLPEPIKRLLNELYLRGPETVGIFRKSPNAKHCKELRQKLEATDDEQNSIEQFQVTVIASVFKEWLRSLPDCLLMSRLYPQWIDVAKLIEPVQLERQRQEQQQQSNRNIDSQNAQDATTVTSSSSSSSSGPESATSSPSTNGDHQQSETGRGELSRALSCSVVETTCHSPAHSPGFPDNEDNLNRMGPLESTQTPVGRYSRRRDFKSVASRQRMRSEDLGYQAVRESDVSRPPMTQLKLRERHTECIRIVRQLLELLDEPNLILLRAIICVLWHIADNSDHNKMSSQNLGVCIGQSLLNDEHQTKKGHTSTTNLYSMRSSSNLSSTSPSSGAAASALKHFSSSTFAKRHRRARSQCLLVSTSSLTNLSHLSSSPSSNISNGSPSSPHNSSMNNCSGLLESSGPQEAAKYVPILVAFMIDNAKSLFGNDIVNLFGKQHPSRESQGGSLEILKQQESFNKLPVGNSPASQTTGTSVSAGQVLEQLSAQKKLNDIEADTAGNQSVTSVVSVAPPVSNQAGVEGEHRRPPTATQRSCFNSFDLLMRSSANLVNNSTGAANAVPKTHRRNLSMSVIVQIGNIAREISESATVADGEPADKLNAVPELCISSSRLSEPGTTTSILIENTPTTMKRPTTGDDHQRANQSSSNFTGTNNSASEDDDEVDSCRRQPSESHSVSPICGSQSGCSIDSGHQQRPLSASESTGSSSRASSSTSGVHSESPAFSSETDTHHHHSGKATTRSSSISASISSPDPSSTTPSICTSPFDMVDGSEMGSDYRLDSAKAMRRQPCSRRVSEIQLTDSTSQQSSRNESTTSSGKETPVPLDRATRRVRLSGGERPMSMASLDDNALMELRSGATSLNPGDNPSNILDEKQQQRQLPQSRDNANCTSEQQAHKINYADQRAGSQQSHTLNRHSSASSYHVTSDRLPKIPFRYTTSCYGGEAVLYYPTCTHLAQQHQQRQQQTHQQLHHRNSFQPQRVCARIHSLDRHSQPWSQQHQSPQRSHVMMLRDYYLSLQEQNQQKQQNLMSQQQRRTPSINLLQQRIQHLHKNQLPASQQPMIVSRVQHIPSHNELKRLQQQQLQHSKYSMHTGAGNLLYPQQQAQELDAGASSAAFAFQRVQPPPASKSRANQFNGLYVKSVASPSHLVADVATIPSGNGIGSVGNHTGLIVRQLRKSDGSGGGAHCGGSASMMAVSQSSLSQQSSKMSSTSSTEHSADDESDDCSTGEWMESTMV